MKQLLSALFLVTLVACSGGRESDFDGGSGTDAGTRTDAGAVCRPACTSIQSCVDGHCVVNACDSGETRCGALCIDTMTDLLHCGSCTKVCPNSPLGSPMCSGGVCGIQCGGSAGEFCPSTSQCSEGHCCPSGEDWCNDHCAPLETDLQNCGACGSVCSALAHGTAACTGGQCHLTCTSPYQSCDTSCANVANDPANCGTCGHDCGAGASCSGGNCVIAAQTCTISATSGWQGCNGLMVVALDELNMTATGMWTTVSGGATTGPAGTETNPASNGLDYRDNGNFNYGALLWRVPSAQPVFAFTSGTEMGYATGDGALQFRINDADLALSGNSGSMSVTVHVTRQ
jgi:hypothetical protein